MSKLFKFPQTNRATRTYFSTAFLIWSTDSIGGLIEELTSLLSYNAVRYDMMNQSLIFSPAL